MLKVGVPRFTRVPQLLVYNQFIKSSCLLLVLIYDCESVEIFSKDERITRSLFDNARRKGFSETTLITDENDGRTKMDIL